MSTKEKSKVIFIDIRTDESLLKKLETAYGMVSDGIIQEGDLSALKLHFGELGNTGFVRPIYARILVDCMKKQGGKVFVTDTNTLYIGMRWNSIDHAECAVKNGFSYSTLGAPVLIADGLRGQNSEDVKVKLKHFEKVHIGADIADSDSLVVLSHFKGHMASGFGGALKNLGMGCASRAGKQQQHSDMKPKVNADKCVACNVCKTWCQVKAIGDKDNKAIIDQETCVGCGECTIACKQGAIELRFDSSALSLQEKMVEYALGAIKGKEKKSLFVNVLMDITPDCDCFPKSDAPLVPNIGILVSKDPVAIDQASYDLVSQQVTLLNSRLEGKEVKDKFEAIRGFDPTIQLTYAEEIGLGNCDYELEKI